MNKMPLQTKKPLNKPSYGWLLLALLAGMGYFTFPLMKFKLQNPTLVKSLTVDAAYDHLVTFSDIARFHNNSRSVLNGYNASASYIYKQLTSKTDYIVEVQHFEVDMFKESEPAVLVINGKTFVNHLDFDTIQKSGSGNVTGMVRVVKDGCSAMDYHVLTGNEVVLLSKDGPCDYKEMIRLAVKMGAPAIMLYSTLPGNGPVKASCKELVNIPVIGLSLSAAMKILEIFASEAHAKPVTATIYTKTEVFKTMTSNVIATTRGGNENMTIVFGSHVDSVPEGPGINDDGSGAAATLELALKFYETGLAKKTVQRMKFAFWSGEELGLLGSTYFVKHLAETQPEELKKIKLNLNHDMLASPNFIRGVYNGYQVSNSALLVPCSVTRDLFVKWFEYKGLEIEFTPFTGRSDYGAFLEHGIPAGGLFTGAEQIKTAEQAKKFGGFVGVAYDPCYHSSCDTLENVELKVMQENMHAMGYLCQRLAFEEQFESLLKGEKQLGNPEEFDG